MNQQQQDDLLQEAIGLFKERSAIVESDLSFCHFSIEPGIVIGGFNDVNLEDIKKVEFLCAKYRMNYYIRHDNDQPDRKDVCIEMMQEFGEAVIDHPDDMQSQPFVESLRFAHKRLAPALEELKSVYMAELAGTDYPTLTEISSGNDQHIFKREKGSQDAEEGVNEDIIAFRGALGEVIMPDGKKAMVYLVLDLTANDVIK